MATSALPSLENTMRGRNMGKTSDKTVYKTTGWCGFGSGSNTAAVDVKDGRIARIRPLHLDDKYTEEELNPWKIEGTYDKDYIATHTESFDWFKDYVLGGAEQYPAEFNRDYDAECGLVASARIVKA